MLDQYNRNITYLRISVTDRCNLRCVYCMPEKGVRLLPKKNVLSFEQIELIVKEAVKLGINKVRLTGGEPLVRKNIEILVEKLSQIQELNEVNITTNGIFFARKAKILKKAGLTRVNISLDTLDRDKYKKITRRGNIDDVLKGIYAAIKENIPTKINMVVMPDTTDEEIDTMQNFCDVNGLKLQLINLYNLNDLKKNNYIFDRPPNCAECNRIRLLPNGILKPCLHSNLEYEIDFNDIIGSLKKAIWNKPRVGSYCDTKFIYEIGG